MAWEKPAVSAFAGLMLTVLESLKLILVTGSGPTGFKGGQRRMDSAFRAEHNHKII
jgi:hypothetical protein